MNKKRFKSQLLKIFTVFALCCLFFNPTLPTLRAAGQTNTPKKADTYGLEGCNQKVLNYWLATVKKDARMHGNKKFTAILFDENLNVAWVNRTYGSVGDLIYVAVIKEKDEVDSKISVSFAPCSQEPDAPSLFVSQSLSLPNGQNVVPPTDDNAAASGEEGEESDQTGEKGTGMVKFPPRSCFSQSVTITVKKSVENSPEGTFILQQYQRYRATLQLGVVFSNLNSGDFSVAGGKIINKGPTNRGPHYMLYTVVYAAPRYIGSLFSSKKAYEGRDILHDQDFFDRIGAVVGVGINQNVADTFHLGLSFEVMYGVNFIGVWEFTQLNQLAAGYHINDSFTGADTDIPVVTTWKSGFVMGLSLDLSYVYNLFKN
jgi:hypothetical protein